MPGFSKIRPGEIFVVKSAAILHMIIEIFGEIVRIQASGVNASSHNQRQLKQSFLFGIAYLRSKDILAIGFKTGIVVVQVVENVGLIFLLTVATRVEILGKVLSLIT